MTAAAAPRRASVHVGVGRALGTLLTLAALAHPARAQDTVPPVEQGVRIGITYTPGQRPGLLVLGGLRAAALDSIRAILERDLDFSDRFEMISLPAGEGLTLGMVGSAGEPAPADPPATGSPAPFVNYPLYAALGAEFAVAVDPGADSNWAAVSLYDVRGAGERERARVLLRDPADPEFRLDVHRVADRLVQAATGEPGIAASGLLFLVRDRVYRIDPDRAGFAPVTPEGVSAFSPTWDPRGQRIVYSELAEGWGRIVVHDLRTGARSVVPPTTRYLNYTPVVSPAGRTLAYTRSDDEGTDIYTYNYAANCCLERLTVGRFSDNLSPTFSPDGRQVAFVSTRAGLPQIYVMAVDGTRQELFAPFDYGVTGSSFAPEWSPDGTRITFHRDVQGSPQVFIMDVRSRVVRQLTSAGRNEDATWAPDGRHLAFVSDRTGTRQIWVIDIETGRIRQLTTVGGASLPAWSPRFTQPTPP